MTGKKTFLKEAAMTRYAGLLLLLLSFCSMSCKEESITISAGDALVDPRIAPRVLYTYPRMNSLGPYAEWEADPNYYYFNPIEVRFNKLMEQSSVRRALRVTSSLRDVVVDSTAVYGDRETFYLSPREVPETYRSYLVGEKFTLSLASPAVDLNGNTLPAGILGTYTPEPAFRVRSIYPGIGSALELYQYEYLFLSFNSKIDSTILPFVSVSAGLGGSWGITNDSMRLYRMVLFAGPADAYAITVAAGAPDKQGQRSAAAFTAVYPGFPFEVVSRSPLDSLYRPLSQTYEIYLSFPMDTSTVRTALHITPETAGGVTLTLSGSTIRLEPGIEYDPRTEYTVRVDTTLRSVGGIRLARQYGFSFTTREFAVRSTDPYNLETGVYKNAGIFVTFDAILDSSTIRRSLSVAPSPAAGIFLDLANTATIRFYSLDTLRSYTTYVVTVDTSIRSRKGQRIAAPFTYSFTTGGL